MKQINFMPYQIGDSIEKIQDQLKNSTNKVNIVIQIQCSDTTVLDVPVNWITLYSKQERLKSVSIYLKLTNLNEILNTLELQLGKADEIDTMIGVVYTWILDNEKLVMESYIDGATLHHSFNESSE